MIAPKYILDFFPEGENPIPSNDECSGILYFRRNRDPIHIPLFLLERVLPDFVKRFEIPPESMKIYDFLLKINSTSDKKIEDVFGKPKRILDLNINDNRLNEFHLRTVIYSLCGLKYTRCVDYSLVELFRVGVYLDYVEMNCKILDEIIKQVKNPILLLDLCLISQSRYDDNIMKMYMLCIQKMFYYFDYHALKSFVSALSRKEVYMLLDSPFLYSCSEDLIYDLVISSNASDCVSHFVKFEFMSIDKLMNEVSKNPNVPHELYVKSLENIIMGSIPEKHRINLYVIAPLSAKHRLEDTYRLITNKEIMTDVFKKSFKSAYKMKNGIYCIDDTYNADVLCTETNPIEISGAWMRLGSKKISYGSYQKFKTTTRTIYEVDSRLNNIIPSSYPMKLTKYASNLGLYVHNFARFD